MFNYSSHLEENIPPLERVFVLEGIIPASIVKRIKRNIPKILINNKQLLKPEIFEILHSQTEKYLHLPSRTTQVHCAVSFAYADIYPSKTFEYAFPYINILQYAKKVTLITC